MRWVGLVLAWLSGVRVLGRPALKVKVAYKMNSLPPLRTFLRQLDLASLDLFALVCETGSIARAAERGGIAASALSRRLAELEVAMGGALLVRHARGARPTVLGQEVLGHAVDLLLGVERLRGDLDAFARGVRGRVRLAASASAVEQFLRETSPPSPMPIPTSALISTRAAARWWRRRFWKGRPTSASAARVISPRGFRCGPTGWSNWCSSCRPAIRWPVRRGWLLPMRWISNRWACAGPAPCRPISTARRARRGGCCASGWR